MSRAVALGMGLLVAFTACASEPTTTPTNATNAFCKEAVPILSRQDLGESPGPMLEQMDDLTKAATENLDQESQSELMVPISALKDRLRSVVSGQAVDGGSNVDVVHFVISLCGEADTMVARYVQS